MVFLCVDRVYLECFIVYWLKIDYIFYLKGIYTLFAIVLNREEP